MSDSTHRRSKSEPQPGKQDRDVAREHAPRRQDYTAGADGDQIVDTGGQLGPDEISDPDEVIRNNDAKHHS
jgi:hypothetical protein